MIEYIKLQNKINCLLYNIKSYANCFEKYIDDMLVDNLTVDIIYIQKQIINLHKDIDSLYDVINCEELND